MRNASGGLRTTIMDRKVLRADDDSFIPFEFLFFLYIRSRFFNSPTSRVPRTKKLQGIRLPTGKFTFYNYFLLSFQNVTSLLCVFLRNIM